MRQKRGKTDVISFRAPRDFADLITNNKLNVLDLVENGIMSYCNAAGPKSESIINGAIVIIDHQISELQERKNNLMNLKEAIPKIDPRVESETSVISPNKQVDQDVAICVRYVNEPNKREEFIPKSRYERHKDLYILCEPSGDD